MVAYKWLQTEQGKYSSILTPLSTYYKEKIVSFSSFLIEKGQPKKQIENKGHNNKVSIVYTPDRQNNAISDN